MADVVGLRERRIMWAEGPRNTRVRPILEYEAAAFLANGAPQSGICDQPRRIQRLARTAGFELRDIFIDQICRVDGMLVKSSVVSALGGIPVVQKMDLVVDGRVRRHLVKNSRHRSAGNAEMGVRIEFGSAGRVHGWRRVWPHVLYALRSTTGKIVDCGCRVSNCLSRSIRPDD